MWRVYLRRTGLIDKAMQAASEIILVYGGQWGYASSHNTGYFLLLKNNNHWYVSLY